MPFFLPCLMTRSPSRFPPLLLVLLLLLVCLPVDGREFVDAEHLSLEVIRRGFHASQKWPICAPIFERVRDQGECNACWAIAPADTIRDRNCIRSAYQSTDYDREHLDAEHFPNVSVTDVLACGKFGHVDTACTIGGRPQMAWHHFQMTGYVAEDDPDAASEFSYTFLPCNHSIPSTDVWIGTRPLSGGKLSQAEDALPYCRRKAKLVPPVCPPSLGNRKRIRIQGVERIGGNNNYRDAGMDIAIMEEIFEHGPVQATMTIFPALATIPFGPLRDAPLPRPYPYVFRCVEAEWLRQVQKNPTAPEVQRQHHSVRIVGWGSVSFDSQEFASLFPAERTSAPAAESEQGRRSPSSLLRNPSPRINPAVASERAQLLRSDRSERIRVRLDAETLERNRFHFSPLNLAFPDGGLADGGMYDPAIVGDGGADDAVPDVDLSVRDADRVIHYWIVANSWGRHFGHDGFFYVQRGKNDCRLSENVMRPILA